RCGESTYSQETRPKTKNTRERPTEVNSYAIQYARSAREELESLPGKVQDRIIEAIDALEQNPRPQGCKKLHGSDDRYRIRIGNYRVIYKIDEKAVTVLIVRIRDRKDAYP